MIIKSLPSLTLFLRNTTISVLKMYVFALNVHVKIRHTVSFTDALTVSVIMNWFATYDKERDEIIHSFNDVSTEHDTSENISREEYKEILLARIAGGDLYANADYMKMCEINNIFFENRFEIGNYKYNRLHKFDKKL